MSITRAQIARQLLAEGGKIGNTTFQLARKRPDGKKPGYYGPDAGHAGEMGSKGFGSDYSTSDVDFGGVSGGTDQQFADTRAAIEARTPKETLGQKIVNRLKNISKFSPSLNIFKGLGDLFGKFQNLRGFNPDGTPRTQAQFEQARRDRINQNRISNIMGRDAPFTAMTLENLRNLGYTGPLEGLLGSTNITRSGTTDDVYPDRVDGIVSQSPQNFREAMANLNLERGVPRDQVFLTAKDFIDLSKTIGSENLGTIQSRISKATGVPMGDIQLAKNYTKQDIENLGAEKGFFGANDQLEALQEYYDAVQKLSGPGSKFAPNNPAKARDFITSQSAMPFGMGSYNIDMDLVPKDFLETQQDLQQQKSPFELLDI
tara:strand:- start:50 stop:1168 length:1119 start_codon:yes stop_codon:yes gene_type:complete